MPRLLAALVCCFALFLGSQAQAVTIVDMGIEYTLSVTGAGGGTAQVTFSADTSGYTQNPNKVVTHMQAINWSLPVKILTANIAMAPGVDAEWTTVFSSLGNGCNNPGQTGKVCTEEIGSLTEAPLGGTLIWKYDVTYLGDLDPDDLGGSHIGAKPNDVLRTVNGLQTSVEVPGTPGSPVPEPSAAIAFALGLAVLRVGVRRP